MVSERWEQVKAAFDSIVNLDAEGRAVALQQLQNRDPDLCADVEELVANDDQASDFLAETLISEDAPRFNDSDVLADRYRIIRFIGRGGMGEVYEVHDNELGERLALKTIIPEIARDHRYIARFLREVKLARNVTNRHVCRVHDVGHHDAAGTRICFLTMELVEGETLAALLLRRRRISVTEAFPLIEQMAEALAAAHAKNIIHRDFKPANIMLAEEDGAIRVVVTDFGLARSVNAIRSVNTRTEDGHPPGTMGYIAPELFWPGADATVASDVYSFGVVIREVVCGKRAARDDSPSQPRPPLDARWDSAIRRCLEPDPERRFKTALEVVHAIRPALVPIVVDVETVAADLAPVRADVIDPAPPAGVDLVPVRTETIRPPAPRRFHLVTWPRTRLAMAITVFVVLAALLLLPDIMRRSTTPEESREIKQITSDFGFSDYPAISHDGKLLVYASDRNGKSNLRLYLRQVDGDATPIPLTRSDADDYAPSFSADDTRIAFRSDRDGGGVYQIPTFGGNAQLIAKDGYGPSYSPDGQWITYWMGMPGGGFLSGSSQVFIKPTSGGPAIPLQTGLVSTYWPVWAPDSKRLLLLGRPDTKQDSSVSVDWWVVSLDGRPPVKTYAMDSFHEQDLKPPLGDDWITPITWLGGQHRILFAAMRGDTTNLWEIPISDAGKVAGPPTRRSFTTSHDLHASVSEAGTGLTRMFFSSLVGGMNVWSLPIDSAGRVTGEILNLTPGISYAAAPSISAAGTELAFIACRSNIWSLKLRDGENGQEATLTSQNARWLRPRVSPDGNTVVYVNNKNHMFSVDRLSGATKKICAWRCGPPTDVSDGGQKVLLEPLDPPEDVMMIDVPSNRITSLVHSDRPDHILYQGRFSPDARWVAFHASLPKPFKMRVFISPIRDGHGAKEADWIPITDGLQSEGDVAWSRDGNLLYFLSERDGFRCVWAQRLAPVTKQPQGKAFAVRHFHTARQSLKKIDRPDLIGLSATQDRLVFSMSELTGNIWMEERNTIARGPVVSRWIPAIFH